MLNFIEPNFEDDKTAINMSKVTGIIKGSDQDLLFSHITFENLHEAVFWIDSHANIFRVNAMACTMTGYTNEELTKKLFPILILLPSYRISMHSGNG